MENLILAIETSCDETAASVIRNGNEILSSVVASQIESQKRFGGVVPEIASRHHVEQITIVIEEALEKANVVPSDLDAVAVTEGPGLVGALLIGINAAKAFAFAHGLPIIGVHHIAGHIYASALVEPLQFPLLALVVSGGHTELVYMKGHGSFEVIGETRDDAAGEAYDKVARVLNLPYPGGPHIDRMAHEAEKGVDFPRAWLEDTYDFSFSGLKSAVINYKHNLEQRGQEIIPEEIAKGFQDSVVEVLTTKTVKAAKELGVKQVIVAGGVSANRGLRESLQKALDQEGIPFTAPPLSLCTDNAAMIGACAAYMYEAGVRGDLSMNGLPGKELKSWIQDDNLRQPNQGGWDKR
ncbi:tRNA (adenosine(37)-N6)-threonylcarbamoyltransferase complex transferase subunit TsaD [Ureibacillus sp. FSL W7-1570]|uniref:tRNA (adenosine(37)-N6)-threonylcarbamoyltransferase complex transferase subunit TsaD n=1 Tax=Ureibacillus sp. FSL W7-1570 TaxID=2954593 RepID=UPI00315A1B01